MKYSPLGMCFASLKTSSLTGKTHAQPKYMMMSFEVCSEMMLFETPNMQSNGLNNNISGSIMLVFVPYIMFVLEKLPIIPEIMLA